MVWKCLTQHSVNAWCVQAEASPPPMRAPTLRRRG